MKFSPACNYFLIFIHEIFQMFVGVYSFKQPSDDLPLPSGKQGHLPLAIHASGPAGPFDVAELPSHTFLASALTA